MRVKKLRVGSGAELELELSLTDVINLLNNRRLHHDQPTADVEVTMLLTEDDGTVMDPK